MRNNIYLLIVIFLGLILASCSDTTTNPPVVTEKGSILIDSSPQGARINVDDTNYGVTPDSVTGLSVGSHTVKLSLTGYRDTVFSVTVHANVQTAPPPVVLVSTLSVLNFGPVRIFESLDPSPDDPSGLDLSTGTAIAISTSDSVNADIYYTSSGFLVQSANLSGHMHRHTYFNISSKYNLNDGEDSPTYPIGGTWNPSMPDTVTRYVYLYDTDSHYSKIKITNMGGGSGTNPAWIEITWIYNNTATDTRF